MLTISEIKEKVTKVCKKYGVKSAYLFGSYAKDMATEDSDVDLILDTGNIKRYKDYFHLCDELETELGAEVDVTSEEGMQSEFFKLIKDERILLIPAVTYPKAYINNLEKEAKKVKADIESGKQPVFSSVDEMLKYMEKN